MDGDLQHDESVVPTMIGLLLSEDCDIVVGTRYADGGSVGEWAASRARQSRIANSIARSVLGTSLSDPMSGFFALSRSTFDSSLRQLSSLGFKILLDIILSAPAAPRIKEVPYAFRTRAHGESKLDASVVWDFFLLLADKSVGNIIPARFLSFALIGGFGVLVHLSVMKLIFVLVGASYLVAHITGTTVALISNFALNNLLTFRDRRLSGLELVRGFLSFAAICSVGIVGNVGIASWLFEQNAWWVLSSIAGIIVGAVWNYSVSSIFTWPARTRSKRNSDATGGGD